MRSLIGNKPKKTTSGNAIENEFFMKYLSENSFRGFYYDSENTSYGLSLYFLPGQDTIMTISALECNSEYSISEFRISAGSFTIEQLAYDKIMISIDRFKVDPGTNIHPDFRMPEKPELIIQLLSRNSLFIYFPHNEMYGSPIRSLKGGLVLTRETEEISTGKNKEVIHTDSFFHV